MRNMSFYLTTEAFKSGRKDVTRRLGWAYLKPGDHFMAVEKAQGLKKGEKIKRLGECVCIYNDSEKLKDIEYVPLRSINNKVNYFWSEPTREGFPDLSPEEFVKMFCRKMKCTPETIVQRIEFMRIDQR